MEDRRAHQGTKRHARLQHSPGAPLLWVGDDEDWKIARAKHRLLACPEPDCHIELIAVQNDNNRYTPRFFRFKTATRTCEHWPARSRGGPESARHDWLKARLARIARREGYQVTPEHWHTHADVFVHDVQFCFEVQLRGTDFAGRTASRRGKGAQVCWFLTPDVTTKIAEHALFHSEAVRLSVVDQSTRRPIAPWDHPENQDLARRAQLRVYATTGHGPRHGQRPDPDTAALGVRWWTTGSMSGYQFLKEILAGTRRWYPPRTIGNKNGMWALHTDVAAYHEFRERQRSNREHLHRNVHEQDAVHNDPVVIAPETSTPTDTPVAEELRNALLQPRSDQIAAASEPPPAPSSPAGAATPQTPTDHTATRARHHWWQFWRQRSR